MRPSLSLLNTAARERFWNFVAKRESEVCWLWSGSLAENGYGRFSVRQDRYTVLHFPAHQIAYLLERSTLPDDLQVLHRCDRRACCNPKHLFLGTQSDNMWDASEKGRIPGNKVNNLRGEAHGMAKLCAADVRRIRTLYASGGYTHRGLAAIFGIGVTQIQRIIHRETWKHLDDGVVIDDAR